LGLVNSVFRKFTRNRKTYPNEESTLKTVYMAIHEASKKWTVPIRPWKQALNHFAILHEGRWQQRSLPRSTLFGFPSTGAFALLQTVAP
jgi:transposase-like protein